MYKTYTYNVDANNIIQSVSDSFTSFARENLGKEFDNDMFSGESIYKFIAGDEVKHMYELLMHQVRTTTKEAIIPFRCDSPSLRRYMELKITCLAGDELQFESALIREESRDPVKLLDYAEANSEELLKMCSWCKRVAVDEMWVELEISLQKLGLFNEAPLPMITHGICEQCLENVRGELT
jgi:hypothetical protein